MLCPSPGLQMLTEVFGDQSRSAIRHQPGPTGQRCLLHTRSLTSRLDHLAEVSSTHSRLESPGQDCLWNGPEVALDLRMAGTTLARLPSTFPKHTQQKRSFLPHTREPEVFGMGPKSRSRKALLELGNGTLALSLERDFFQNDDGYNCRQTQNCNQHKAFTGGESVGNEKSQRP